MRSHLLPRRYVATYKHPGPRNTVVTRRRFWATSPGAAKNIARGRKRPAGTVLSVMVQYRSTRRRQLQLSLLVGILSMLIGIGWTAAYQLAHPGPYYRVVPMHRVPVHVEPPAEDSAGWNCHLDGNKQCEARLRSGLS